ncbi:MAG: GlcNAc deacetylase, Carbohydrate Esterase Family 4-like protein [Ramlibacter sp.]|nr:GlcNAc deacetylase, Carbohydrate Esterase Family 4-like protein [Ramlibacter sp.]
MSEELSCAGQGWRPTPLVAGSIALHAAALLLLAWNPGWWLELLVLVALNHAVITVCGLLPRSRWLGPNMTRLPAAAAARREIAITIDDGPDPAVTPAVLDILDRHQAQATFFCIGARAHAHADLCREIVRRGHAVENHSQRHRHSFAFMGPGGFRRELQEAQDTLAAITGRRPAFFRAPAGLRNPLLDPVLHALGLRLASWTRRGFDTRVADPQLLLRRLSADLGAGDILLLHDGNSALTPAGRPAILEVLPQLLERAAAAGLRPVTLRTACA